MDRFSILLRLAHSLADRDIAFLECRLFPAVFPVSPRRNRLVSNISAAFQGLVNRMSTMCNSASRPRMCPAPRRSRPSSHPPGNWPSTGNDPARSEASRWLTGPSVRNRPGRRATIHTAPADQISEAVNRWPENQYLSSTRTLQEIRTAQRQVLDRITLKSPAIIHPPGGDRPVWQSFQ